MPEQNGHVPKANGSAAQKYAAPPSAGPNRTRNNGDIEMRRLRPAASRIDMNGTAKSAVASTIVAMPTTEEKANAKKMGLGDVVRTAMIVRNWMMSVQDAGEEDRTSEMRDSLAFDPVQPIAASPAPTSTVDDSAEHSSSGIRMVAHKVKDFGAAVVYFHMSPQSYLYYFWTMLVFMAVLYNMFAMVIFIFDDVLIGFYQQWVILNAVADGIYLLDILVQTRKTFIFDGSEVKNVKLTWKAYYRSFYIFLDIAALLPLDFLLFISPNLSLVRTIRLLKGYRINDFVELTQRRTIFPNVSKIAFLVLSCFILFHWNACLYFLFSLYEGLSEDDTEAFGFSYYKVFDVRVPTCRIFEDPDCGVQEDYSVLSLALVRNSTDDYMHMLHNHWVGKYRSITLGNFSREYAMSIYWSALTITTCGQQPWPSTSPQNMLEVLDTLIGVLVFATIIGGVGSVVTQMNSSTNDFRKKMDGIKFYMKYRNVEHVIQQRVLSCLRYMNAQNQLNDENELLSVLPPRLQGQIAVNLHMETLRKVELFKEASPGLLYEIVLRMKQHVFSPNDYLCRSGDRAKEMFIVKRGRLDVIDDDGETAVTIRDGQTFGEMSVIHVTGNVFGDARGVSLRSVGYSDVYILEQEDVVNILQEYPEDRDLLYKTAYNMLRCRGMLDENERHDNDEDEEMRGLSLEEQLEKLKEIVEGMESQINNMSTSFHEFSTNMKQRVTTLEDVYSSNRKRIKRDYIRGVL